MVEVEYEAKLLEETVRITIITFTIIIFWSSTLVSRCLCQVIYQWSFLSWLFVPTLVGLNPSIWPAKMLGRSTLLAIWPLKLLGLNHPKNGHASDQSVQVFQHAAGESFRAMPSCRRSSRPPSIVTSGETNLSSFQVDRMEWWYHSSQTNHASWCPRNYRLVTNPWTIDISTVNPNNWSYKPT